MFSKVVVFAAVLALATAGGPLGLGLGGLGYGGAVGFGGHGAVAQRITPVYRTAPAAAVHVAARPAAIGFGYGGAIGLGHGGAIGLGHGGAIGLGHGGAIGLGHGGAIGLGHGAAIKAPTSTVYFHSGGTQVAAHGVVAAAPQIAYAAAPRVAYAAPQIAYAHAAPRVAYAAPQVAYAHAPQIAYAAAAPVKAIAAVKAVAYPPQPYEFGYSQQNDDGAHVSRQEASDGHNNKQGSYSIQNPDGTYRHVEYVADAAGFRASIKTNEHGTSPQSPANVHILAEEPPYKVLPAAQPALIKTAPAYHAPALIKAAPAIATGHVYAAAPAIATGHAYQNAIPSAILRSQAGFGGGYGVLGGYHG